MVYSPGKCW